MAAARVARGWQLSLPLVFPGDAPSLEAMARSLSEMVSVGRVDDPVDASVYGLGSSAIEIGFEAKRGGGRIRLGRQTPVGASVYAAVERDRGGAESEGGEEIHMIGTIHAAVFDRTALELRDRRVLDFEPDQISRVRVAAFGADANFGVTLERREDGWTIVWPAPLAADDAAVERLLSDLSLLRAEFFVDDPYPALRAALKTPTYEVALEGPSISKLILTRTPADEAAGLHIAQGRDGHLYRISDALVAHLPSRLFALREKQVAHFDVALARRVELRFGAEESIWIERSDASSPWTSAAGVLVPGPIDALLLRLSQLDAVEVVAEALGVDEQAALGLVPARLRIRVLGSEPANGEAMLLADVRFGTRDPDRGPVARSDDRDEIHRLDASLDGRLPWDATIFAREFLAEESANLESGGD